MNPDDKERRVTHMVLAIVFILAVLVGRLGYMQIAQGQQYASLAQGNRIRMMPIPAARGMIVDAHGHPLVTSRPAYALSFFNYGHPPSQHELSQLAHWLQVPLRRLDRVVTSAQQLPYQSMTLVDALTPSQYSRVAEHLIDLPGITVQAVPLRDDLLGPIGAQVFGYVSQVSAAELKSFKDPRLTAQSIVGQAGLEYEYQKYLQGTPGGEEVEVNALGQPAGTLGTVPPKTGDTLVLNMRQHLETVAYDALKWQMNHLRTTLGAAAPATTGAAVVMQVHTGKVLAMVSLPSYNPNWFAQGISTAQWDSLLHNPLLPMTNRAVSAAYPPGSTFKMVVAIAGLATHILTPSTLIPGLPVYWYPPYPHDWIPVNLGMVGLAQAIAQSVDTYFYEAGRRIGMDLIAKYARKVGFGAPTGIDLPGESSGLVPTVAYEKAKNGGAFYPGLNYITAIGQGDNLETLIQLVDYAGLLANHGTLYRPYLVDKILTPHGKLVKQFRPQVRSRIYLPEADWQVIAKGMRGAIHPGSIPGPGGTAGAFWVNFPSTAACKTGTAQIGHHQIRAFFVCYAPASQPQISVAVTINGGGEGADVSPVTRDILDAYLHLNDPSNPFFASHHQLYGLAKVKTQAKGTRTKSATKRTAKSVKKHPVQVLPPVLAPTQFHAK